MNAMSPITRTRVINHAHLFCGLGGAAKGFNQGYAKVGNVEAEFRCLGGIDVDPAAVRDFAKLAKVPGTVIDLFSRDQYRRFHGHEPPEGWREALPQDIHRAFQHQHPHVLVTSPPCKGFSGLLAESAARTDKYQALNELAVRGIWLTLEAYADDPIELIVLENVPRMATRGEVLLDQIRGVMDHFGYSTAVTMHDCGELGGLGQSRKRLLMVARHRDKVPAFLYEPPKRGLRGVGEIIGKLPLPGDPAGGPMHRVPALQWQTWVRLALVEAGKDWRSLNRLRVENGHLADYGIIPERELRNGAYGVRRWDEHCGAVAGESLPTNGSFAVADPRAASSREGAGFLGVREWAQPSGTVTGNARPGTGAFSVADPRAAQWSEGQLGVNGWDQTAPTITSQRSPLQGRFSVADPRADGWRDATLGVVDFAAPCGAITANAEATTGRFSVADPRIEGHPRSVQLGVRPWDKPAATVTGNMWPGAGPNCIADPRPDKNGPRFNNVYRVVAFDQPSPAVTGQGGNSAGVVADPRGGPHQHTGGKYRVTPFSEPTNTVIAGSTTGQGAFAVADPRTGYGPNAHTAKLAVTDWDKPTRTVTGANQVQGGAMSIADPRPACVNRPDRRDFVSSRHWGVTSWSTPSLAIPGFAKLDNGPWSVADPREAEGDHTVALPRPTDRLVAVIRSIDGTWHRPFTTAELAALQGLLDPEDPLCLDGTSDAQWRERVGNAIPSGAAQAMACVMGETLLLSWAGETFQLSSTPIWVRPLAVGLSIDCPGLDSAYMQ